MSEAEKQEIINALKVLKSVCISYSTSTEIEGDPCFQCPFLGDEHGNCVFTIGWSSPQDWKINEENHWRAFHE